MTETVYTADSELLHPSRFLQSAKEDLRHAGRVAWQLFQRNIQARYRRTWLGYVWLLLPTLAMTIVWVYIRSLRIVDIAPTAVPYPVHVLAGMALWQTFLDALNAPLQHLGAGRQLITRSRLPQEALIAAGAMEVLLNCAVRLLVLALVLLWYDVRIGSGILYAPIGIGALMLLGLAIGVFLSPVGLLYDDVGRAITMVASFWFFLTPVVYPAPREGILRFNPVTPLLESSRAWLTSSGGAADGFLLVSVAAMGSMVVAWLLLRLARPHVVARLG